MRCAAGPATRRGGTSFTASAIARMCSGVVPQQPPTMLTKPLRANSRAAAPSSPASRRSRSRSSGWAGPRSDSTRRRCRRRAESSSMYGRISAAPSAQLSPTASGRAWRTEFQNASGVWPDSVRPEASVMVPEMMMRQAYAACARNSASIANSAALALSVSKIVSTSSRSTPPSTSAVDRLAVGRDQIVEADVAKAGIVDVGRDRRRAVGRAERAGDEARLVRRFRGPRVGALAREPRRREIDLAHAALQARSRPARSTSR